MPLATTKNVCSLEEQPSVGVSQKNNMSAQVRICSFCRTPMKKQVIGSNVVYYCKHCGCTRST